MSPRFFSPSNLCLIVVLLILNHFPCRAQTSQTRETALSPPPLFSGYVYYHNTIKENTYAQLNKATYLAGEHLWFKIYVTDAKSGDLSFSTNKVYTDLYAPDGSLYTRNIWHVQDGCVYGQINLSDTLLGGMYTFKAYTNWQRNFEPERMFLTNIQIKSFDSYAVSPPEPAPLWDIQFFPEGGDLIAGTAARLAVKGVDEYGNGSAFFGKVVSAQGDTIASFETNRFGMGSFVLPKEYSGYSGWEALVLLPDGKTETIPLPKANDVGVSLQVNAVGKEVIDIFLNTNESTLQAFVNQPFYCMVHQNGLVVELYKINALNSVRTKLQVAREQLAAGINTVTLFDASFRPVSERLFFAEKEEALGSVEITAVQVRDSIEVRLQTTDIKGFAVPSLLSASVLPATTLAGDFDSNMYAQLFLSADVRGAVENPAYYFQERTIERLQALDNLLLTQAWRKYDWNRMMSQNAQPDTPYPFEYGFQVSGKSMRQTFVGNVSTTKSEVVLNMPTEPFTKSAEMDANGSFVFDSLLIYKPFNQLFLIAMDLKGAAGNRLLQDVAIVTQELNNSGKTKLSPVKETGEIKEDEDDSWLQFVESKASLLTAATVTARRSNVKEIMVNDPYVSQSDNFYLITEENIGFYNNPFDVLQHIFGYQISRDEEGRLIPVGKRSMATIGMILSGENYMRPPPILIIDGVPVRDWEYLETLAIEDIEAISEHPSANVLLGSDGMFGTISVKTRTKPLMSRNDQRNFTHLVVEGYEAPIAYYAPSYSNITNKNNLSYYTALHWEPDIISPEGESVFRFYAPYTEQNVRIRVEGIAVDGMLFSTDATVNIPK